MASWRREFERLCRRAHGCNGYWSELSRRSRVDEPAMDTRRMVSVGSDREVRRGWLAMAAIASSVASSRATITESRSIELPRSKKRPRRSTLPTRTVPRSICAGTTTPASTSYSDSARSPGETAW